MYSTQGIFSEKKSNLIKKLIEENRMENSEIVDGQQFDVRAVNDNNLMVIGIDFDFADVEVKDSSELTKMSL